MATITTLPPKLFAEQILPRLSTQDTIAFSRVSEQAQRVLTSVARVPNEDFDFEGNRITSVPTFVPFLLQQKWRMEIFTRRPELLGCLRRKDVNRWCVDRGMYLTTESMLSLILNDFNEIRLGEYFLEEALSRATFERIQDNRDNRELLKAVLFHPKAQSISADCIFSEAHRSIECDRPETLRTILLHPAAAKIPGAGPHGLEKLLFRALDRPHKGSEEMVKAILSHRYAIHIPAEGIEGLGAALGRAISRGNLAIGRMILANPNTKKIPTYGGVWGLQYLLCHAVFKKERAQEETLQWMEWILSLPNAYDIDDQGDFSLGSTLQGAVMTKSVEIVKKVLSLPNAKKIKTYACGYDIECALEKARQQHSPEIILELGRFSKIEERTDRMLAILLAAALELGSPDLEKIHSQINSKSEFITRHISDFAYHILNQWHPSK